MYRYVRMSQIFAPIDCFWILVEALWRLHLLETAMITHLWYLMDPFSGRLVETDIDGCLMEGVPATSGLMKRLRSLFLILAKAIQLNLIDSKQTT